MSNMVTMAAELLEQAADAWRSGRVKWSQSEFIFHDIDSTRACAVGGINLAAERNHGHKCLSTERSHNCFICVAMDSAVCAVSDHIFGTIASWNDHPDREQQEVIDLFELAAKDLRNGAQSS